MQDFCEDHTPQSSYWAAGQFIKSIYMLSKLPKLQVGSPTHFPKWIRLGGTLLQRLISQVKVLKGEGLPTNYRSQTANISVKLSLLPSRLPKVIIIAHIWIKKKIEKILNWVHHHQYTTGVVEDSTDPEFNEEFSFFVSRCFVSSQNVRFFSLKSFGTTRTATIVNQRVES